MSADGILPICTEVEKYKKNCNIDFDIILPKSEYLRRLFINTNWAHILNDKFDESKFSGFTQYPTVKVANDDDLSDVMKGILECIIRATRIESYESFAVVEWCINEILENVLRHSNSEFGALIHMSKFKKNHKIVEVVIADGGIGIPDSLRDNEKYANASDPELIYEATREGITNGKGQGNGLFGALYASRLSGGYFKIMSGRGSLMADCDRKRVINSKLESIPFKGCVVCMALNYAEPKILENALQFNGKIHNPVSTFLDVTYGNNEYNINLKKEIPSCSTRNYGENMRNKILNLLTTCGVDHVSLIFDGVGTVTSSFADELFGKLYNILGKDIFFQKIRIKNLSSTSKFIVNRAIVMREKSDESPQV